MDAAGLRVGDRPDRQGDVEALGLQPAGKLLRLEDGAAGGDRLADPLLQPVQRRAHDLSLRRRHAAEALQELGDDALLAERGDALGFERRLVGGAATRARMSAFERGEIGRWQWRRSSRASLLPPAERQRASGDWRGDGSRGRRRSTRP